MSAIEQFADAEEHARRYESAASWRSYVQHAAGLNDAEGDILMNLASECNEAVEAEDAKVKAAVQKFRAQAGNMRAPLPPEILKMNDQRAVIINSYIEKLREALGERSFQKLDHYIQSVSQPQVVPLKQPGKSKAHKDNQ